jgi:hypothetical protein
MGRAQTAGVASAVALTVVLAAVSMNGGDRREVEELQAPLPSPFGEGLGFSGEEQAGASTRTKTGARGRDKFGIFTDDSLKLKRQQVMSELKGLRGLDAGVSKQMALLEQQESALKSAWQTTSSEMADTEAQKKLQHGREALASSGFPEVFHGAGLTAGSTVCEPWPRCCPRGNSDNCYGVISGGVLGAHTCSPYPSCCGTSISNCFDSQAVELTPSGSPIGPNPHDMAALTTFCEGPEKMKQCLTQTQRCMTPSADSAGNNADACTCFSSSLYCSFPQTPENCSPCPMACQQHIYDWFQATQDEMDGLHMKCALFEKAMPDDDISALDDGSFRPYSWFSDKELHPEPIVAPLPVCVCVCVCDTSSLCVTHLQRF